jgi:hypothetical protein
MLAKTELQKFLSDLIDEHFAEHPEDERSERKKGKPDA